MSTNIQIDTKKIETRQVRLAIEVHKQLKLEAARRGITMSSLLAKMIISYLNNEFDRSTIL